MKRLQHYPTRTFDPGTLVVVGAPRTGFTLLINVLSRLKSLLGKEPPALSRLVRCFVQLAGDHVSREIVRAIEGAGYGDSLVYSPNFRFLAGGPRWIEADAPDDVCFRKYIGIKGVGDFTLITRHPREILRCQDIMHTHSNPHFWAEEGMRGGYFSFASLRDPVGTIYSSCFSINALTSEYIQRFLPPEKDNDALREDLALYKLTDMRFFRGLIGPLLRYLEEFIEVQNNFQAVMRWEDLLIQPYSTIHSLASSLGVDLLDRQVEAIWTDIAWKNLTGKHEHNLRRGHGIVGGWRRYLVNEHLAVMRDMGLERLRIKLGYGPLLDLDPADYTPYQRRIADLLARNEVYRNYEDPWIFEFAFNKSNLDASEFSFKRYDWKLHTCIERSSMKDDRLVDLVSDVAERAVGKINEAVSDLARHFESAGGMGRDFASSHVARFRDVYIEHGPNTVERLAQSPQAASYPPRLLLSLDAYNIVAYQGRFLGLPKALGPLDVAQENPEGRSGVLVSHSFSELMRILPDEK